MDDLQNTDRPKPMPRDTIVRIIGEGKYLQPYHVEQYSYVAPNDPWRFCWREIVATDDLESAERMAKDLAEEDGAIYRGQIKSSSYAFRALARPYT